MTSDHAYRRVVTDADIERFAELSGDHHPAHTDAAFGESSRFGGRVAHGLLVVAIASGLLHERGIIDERIEAFLDGTFKFLTAVRSGDTLRDETILVFSKPTRSGQTTVDGYKTTLFNQRDESVLEMTWTFVSGPAEADR